MLLDQLTIMLDIYLTALAGNRLYTVGNLSHVIAMPVLVGIIEVVLYRRMCEDVSLLGDLSRDW